MTDQQQHPTITPPPELRKQWQTEVPYRDGYSGREHWLIDRAAQWGYEQRGEINETKLQQARDEELEACIEVIADHGWFANPVHRMVELRAARRPKPPSLKKQALEDLDQIDGHAVDQLSAYLIHDDLKQRVSNIRRALEALPDDE